MKNLQHLFLIAVLFIVSSCGTTKTVPEVAKADPLIGKYNLIVKDTPEGDMPVTLIITKNEANAYSGNLESELGTLPLNDFKIENNALSSTFETQGMTFDLTGKFANAQFDGYVSGMGADFKADGKKVMD